MQVVNRYLVLIVHLKVQPVKPNECKAFGIFERLECNLEIYS